ncbi:MAG: hypothetical protein RL385_4254 [Pseudomonadota bacterium]
MAHRSVLILDDDPSSQRALQDCLRDAGYILTCATTLADARSVLRDTLPAIVLLDPAADQAGGLTFLAELRAAQATRALPVILLCGEASAGLRGKAVAHGIQDQLSKPFYPRHGLARIALHLGDRARAEGAVSLEARGPFAEQGAIGVFDALEAAGRTCFVTLSSRGRVARIYVNAGRIVDAEYGTHRGEHALFRVLSWDVGHYALSEEAGTRPDRIGVSVAGLRMEALRRRDAAAQLWASLPAGHTMLVVDRAVLGTQNEARDDDHNGVTRLFDAERSIDDVLERAAGDELALLCAIARLLQRNILVQAADGRGRDVEAGKPPAKAPNAGHTELQALAVAGQSHAAGRTWRPVGKPAATGAQQPGEPGVRIGGVQLRRVLAPATSTASRIGVQNDQVGVNLGPGTEQDATDAVKTPPPPRDVGTERGGVAVRSEAEPPMPKQSKRTLTDSSVNPRDGDGSEAGVVIPMLKSSRREGTAAGEGAAAEPSSETGSSGMAIDGRLSDHGSGMVDDDDHPDVAGFFDATPGHESDTPSRRAQAFLDLHDVHDDHHESRVHHVPGKTWALTIAFIGAVAIGSFLVYHKLWMPTPAELGSAPVRMPTPEMMQGVEVAPVAGSAERDLDPVAPAELVLGPTAEGEPTEAAPTAGAEPTEVAPTAEGEPTEVAALPADAPPKVDVPPETVPKATPDEERDERVRALLAKAVALDFRRSAESVYREVLKLAPDTVDAHSGLAMVALNRGKNREARKHAEHALSLRNNDGTALIVLGATFTAEGNKEKARAAYQRCAALPGKYAAECKRMLH